MVVRAEACVFLHFTSTYVVGLGPALGLAWSNFAYRKRWNGGSDGFRFRFANRVQTDINCFLKKINSGTKNLLPELLPTSLSGTNFVWYNFCTAVQKAHLLGSVRSISVTQTETDKLGFRLANRGRSLIE